MKFEGKLEIETENSTEREKIIAGAREERVILRWEMLKKFLHGVGHVMDITPVVGNFKMGPEAIMGKTFAGRKLSKEERHLYAVIILTSSLYPFLLADGASQGDTNEVMLGIGVWATTVGLSLKQKRLEIKGMAGFIEKNAGPLGETLKEADKFISKYGEENVKELLEKVAENKKENGNN